MDKLLDGGLVGAIVARRPEWVFLVQLAIVEDAFMHSAGGNENKTSHARSTGGLDQAERADDVSVHKPDQIPLAAAVATTGMVQRRMNDGITPFDEGCFVPVV